LLRAWSGLLQNVIDEAIDQWRCRCAPVWELNTPMDDTSNDCFDNMNGLFTYCDSQGRRKHFRIAMAKIIPYHGLTMEGPKVPSETREARSAGAPSGVVSGEGRRSPSPVWGSGGYAPRKFFRKSTLKSHIFKHFCKLKIKWSHLQCR